jgi:hypothetical protein
LATNGVTLQKTPPSSAKGQYLFLSRIKTTTTPNMLQLKQYKAADNEQLNKEVGKMLKTLIDPAVEEKGRIQGIEIGREEGREEIKAGIHELLSDFGDYTQYKGELSSRLCDIKDLSKMKELFMTAARVKSAKEFIDRL